MDQKFFFNIGKHYAGCWFGTNWLIFFRGVWNHQPVMKNDDSPWILLINFETVRHLLQYSPATATLSRLLPNVGSWNGPWSGTERIEQPLTLEDHSSPILPSYPSTCICIICLYNMSILYVHIICYYISCLYNLSICGMIRWFMSIDYTCLYYVYIIIHTYIYILCVFMMNVDESYQIFRRDARPSTSTNLVWNLALDAQDGIVPGFPGLCHLKMVWYIITHNNSPYGWLIEVNSGIIVIAIWLFNIAMENHHAINR